MAEIHPDGRLVLLIRAGDLDALGELYEQYKARMYRTALAITREPGAAEDILQETFLRLYRYADRIYTDVSVEPWLYRVTVNLSHTWVQKSRRFIWPLGGALERLTAPLHLLPDRLMERIETQEAVHRAVAKLPLNHRTVVILFYLEELELKEIAAILDIPEGTVKSRLFHARKLLRRVLGARKPTAEIQYEFT